MKQRILFFFLLVLLGAESSGQTSRQDSIKNYIGEALELFKEKSVYSRQVNWNALQDSLRHIPPVTTYAQADDIIRAAFRKLQDKHGLVRTGDSVYRLPVKSDRRFSQGILDEYKKPRSIKIAMLPNRVGYYKMPAVLIGSNRQKMKEWANKLSDSLCKLLEQNPKSLIIDLRMNNGGNSTPMLESMKTLLGNNMKIYGADKDYNIMPDEPDSASKADNPFGVPDRLCDSKDPNMKIAVLIGPGTASSGEILAMAFNTRKNTRLFGEESAGYCNATQGFRLPYHNFYTLLSVNFVADSKKRVNKENRVYPDVHVRSEDNYNDPLADPTVQAALKWLK